MPGQREGALGQSGRGAGEEPLGEQECPGSAVKPVRSLVWAAVGLWDRVLLFPPTPGPGAGSAENQDSKVSSEAPGTISGYSPVSTDPCPPPTTTTKLYLLKAP